MRQPVDQIFTIAALRAAYAEGVRPVDVVGEALRRLEAVDDPGIFLSLTDPEVLLAEAGALGGFDPDKPLWGIPFAVKDNIDARGHPTTAGCPAFAYTPKQDAFVVDLLRRQGALLVGKTNLDQFATGLVGLRTPHPAPKNALDAAIVPGGSSSGSAVAVAHGMVAFALGTDTAGSGRVPAALNNIVGLKPTLGALSNTGVVPACRTLDTVSIFAQTVADAYCVLRETAVYDPGDPYARRVEVPQPGACPPHPNIGVPSDGTIEFFGDDVQAASFGRTLDLLRSQGAQITEIDFRPFHDVARMLYEGAWIAERHTVVADLLAADPDAIHPVTRQIIEPAALMSAADAFRGFYRLEELKRRAEVQLAGVDLLCVPTIPTIYTIADLEADPIGPNSRLGTYTNFVNLLGLAGLAVPTAPRSDGWPGSVTLLASAGSDALLASLARRIESVDRRCLGATDWPVPRDRGERGASASTDEIELAVCGAHMSGLPLNHELTSLGARFLRSVATEPLYRLHALPVGPPARPGMVRVAEGNGAAVEVEVWALPINRFGQFVKSVPAPLVIGTVHLSDGTRPKGFLCEEAGLQGAEDITRLGSWRRYVFR